MMKRFLQRLPAIALALGLALAVTGCGNGTGAGNPAGTITNPALNGIWVYFGEWGPSRFDFNNGSWAYYQWSGVSWSANFRGTFTTSANTITMRATYARNHSLLPGPEWLDLNAFLALAGWDGWQDGEFASVLAIFQGITAIYTLAGNNNNLTMWLNGEMQHWVRQ